MSCPSQCLEAIRVPWLLDAPVLRASHRSSSIATSPSLTLTLLPSSPAHKEPCDYTEPAQIVQGKLLSRGQLISNLTSFCTKSPLPCKHNTLTGSEEWNMDILGTLILPATDGKSRSWAQETMSCQLAKFDRQVKPSRWFFYRVALVSWTIGRWDTNKSDV